MVMIMSTPPLARYGRKNALDHARVEVGEAHREDDRLDLRRHGAGGDLTAVERERGRTGRIAALDRAPEREGVEAADRGSASCGDRGRRRRSPCHARRARRDPGAVVRCASVSAERRLPLPEQARHLDARPVQRPIVRGGARRLRLRDRRLPEPPAVLADDLLRAGEAARTRERAGELRDERLEAACRGEPNRRSRRRGRRLRPGQHARLLRRRERAAALAAGDLELGEPGGDLLLLQLAPVGLPEHPPVLGAGPALLAVRRRPPRLAEVALPLLLHLGVAALRPREAANLDARLVLAGAAVDLARGLHLEPDAAVRERLPLDGVMAM